MTTYKNRKDMWYTETRSWETDNVREASVNMGLHTGTHIDAPSHMLEDGTPIARGDIIIEQCQVLDLTSVTNGITKEDLMKHNITAPAVLLKTANSSLDPTEAFDPKFIYLEESGAQYLAEQNVTAVGIDYLGIERDQPDHPTHKILFNANIAIIEGLRLEAAESGTYQLICLPLALEGIDAAPARAVLASE